METYKVYSMHECIMAKPGRARQLAASQLLSRLMTINTDDETKTPNSNHLSLRNACVGRVLACPASALEFLNPPSRAWPGTLRNPIRQSDGKPSILELSNPCVFLPAFRPSLRSGDNLVYLSLFPFSQVKK